MRTGLVNQNDEISAINVFTREYTCTIVTIIIAVQQMYIRVYECDASGVTETAHRTFRRREKKG